jgi:hypothetical protein
MPKYSKAYNSASKWGARDRCGNNSPASRALSARKQVAFREAGEDGGLPSYGRGCQRGQDSPAWSTTSITPICISRPRFSTGRHQPPPAIRLSQGRAECVQGRLLRTQGRAYFHPDYWKGAHNCSGPCVRVVPQALGQTVEFVECDGPRLEPLRTEKDVAIEQRRDSQVRLRLRDDGAASAESAQCDGSSAHRKAPAQ